MFRVQSLGLRSSDVGVVMSPAVVCVSGLSLQNGNPRQTRRQTPSPGHRQLSHSTDKPVNMLRVCGLSFLRLVRNPTTQKHVSKQFAEYS